MSVFEHLKICLRHGNSYKGWNCRDCVREGAIICDEPGKIRLVVDNPAKPAPVLAAE